MRILARMDDAARLAQAADDLANGIIAALPLWVERCVDGIYRAWAGPPPAEVVEAARRAGAEAVADIGPRLRDLLAADIDEQRSTPLALVREAVPYPTQVLAAAGVAGVQRDEIAEVMFPKDTYGLTPASFGDLAPGLTDVGIAWGAAKAWEHRRRHR